MGIRKFNNQTTYLKILRAFFAEKFGLHNTFSCPRIGKAVFFVELKSLENFDNSRIVAAMFILRLLSNQKPYVARFSLFQTFKEKNYDALAKVDVNVKSIPRLLELLSCEIFPFLPYADLGFSVLKNNNGFLINFIIKDLSFLRVVETHSIFFKWHDSVKLTLSVVNVDSFMMRPFLSSLKFDVDYLYKKI